MAGTNPAMIVRVAATIEELRRNLAEGKSQIETTTAAMQKMAASFSGDKLIQQANNVAAAVQSIGGVTKLTGAEQERVNSILDRALEKYRALGREAPAGMQQLADATKQATASGEGFSSFLGNANNLLGAFGVSLSVAGLVGFGRAILADADALMKLHDQTGISVEGLQRFQDVGDGAGNTLEEITAAILKMQDNLAGGNANALAALERIGISFADIKHLSPEQQFIAISDAIRQVQDPSAQVNAAIDILGKTGARVLPTLKQGFDDVKGSAVGMKGPTVEAIDGLGDALAHLERQGKGLAGTVLGEIFFGWAYQAKAFAEQMKNVPPPVQNTADAAHALTLSVADTKAAEDALTESAKASIAVNEKMAGAMRELNSAGQGWKGTLDTIDGSVVEAIKLYLQAGVSQGALATAYGLTETQVRAVASALQDEKAAQQQSAAETAAHAKAAQDAAAALDREAEQLKKVKEHAQQVAAAEREAAEAKKALNRAMGNTLDIASAVKVDPELAALLHMGWSLENAEQILLSQRYNFTPKLFSPSGMPENSPDPSERVPGYASGIRNAPGGWAMVGERGPEPMYVPPGADIYPSGSGGGAMNHIVINITQPLGTAAAIAGAVDAAIVKRMRDRGFRY